MGYGGEVTTLNYIFRRPDWENSRKGRLKISRIILRLYFFAVADFRRFQAGRGINKSGLVAFVLGEQSHVAVAEGYADAEATGRLSGNNVIFRVAHHQHIGNIDAQYFGRMLKRQWAGLFLCQAVSAENQAEIAVEIELFQQLGSQHFIFVGNDNQRDAQGFEHGRGRLRFQGRGRVKVRLKCSR